MLTNCENHTCKYWQSWHWQTRREYSLVNSSGGLLTFKLEPCPSKSPQTQHWHNERNSWTVTLYWRLLQNLWAWILEILCSFEVVVYLAPHINRVWFASTKKAFQIHSKDASMVLFMITQDLSVLLTNQMPIRKVLREKIIAQEDFCLTWRSIYLNGFPSRLLAKWRP